MARTYTLESVEKKIENFEAFVERAEKKKAKLPELYKIRAELLNPENVEKATKALEKKAKEIERLRAQIEAAEKRNNARLAEKAGKNVVPEEWNTLETYLNETTES